MLFAAFDWNEVLTRALIGGVIGAVVGLAIWAFKKATGTGAKAADEGPKRARRVRDDDEDNDEPPWKRRDRDDEDDRDDEPRRKRRDR